ncbi:MAG: ATP-binding protein [Rhodocyclaceae bacterium]|nr:ATP-binding protein [Rhodocyclaceae bacterium]
MAAKYTFQTTISADHKSLAIPVLILCAFVAYFGWDIYDSYQTTLDGAYRELEISARHADIQLVNAFRETDLLMNDAAERAASAPRSTQTSAWLRTRLERFPELKRLGVTDREGRFVIQSDPHRLGADISARPLFQAAKAARPGSRRLPMTVMQDIDGRWGVSIAKPYFDRQGRFMGVVSGFLNPGFFDHLLRSARNDDKSIAALIKTNGEMPFIAPDPEPAVRKNALDEPAFLEHLAQGGGVTRHLVKPKYMHSRYLVVLHDSGDASDPDLQIGIGRDYADATANWRQHTVQRLAVAALVAATMMALIALARRRLRVLADERNLLRTLIEAENNSISIKAIDGKYLLGNRRHAELFGASSTDIPGHTAGEFLAGNAEAIAFEEAHDRAALESLVPVVRQTWYTRPGGRPRRFEKTKTLLRNEQGQALAIVSIGRDITEQYLAEEKLRHSEHILKRAQEIGKTGSWEINVASGRLTMSEEVYRILELPPDSPSNMEVFYSRVHPDDRALVTAAWNAAVAGADYHCLHRVLSKEGVKWVVERADVERDAAGIALHAIGTTQDITALHTASQRLQDALELNRRIVDESPAGIVLFHSDGRCLTFNPAAHALASGPLMPERQLKELNFRQNPTWQAAGLLQAAEKVLESGVRSTDEYHLVTRSGKDLWVEITLVPLTLNDEKHLLAVFTDVRKYRETEAAQREAMRLAQSANEAKSNFLANMSHEIRTPMNAILGLAQLARSETDDAARQGYLKKISTACGALLSILNEILDLSRIEAGQMQLVEAPFSMADVVIEAIHLFQPQAVGKGLELTVELAPELPARLIGDALRIGQILNNLLANAIKFTERGRIDVKIEVGEPSAPGRARVLLSIADTGIGIDGEKIGTLFQPFEQGDASITRRYGGSGLGLAICRRLLTLMNGRIEVESWPDSGSVFRVELDLDIATAGSGNEAGDNADFSGLGLLLGEARILMVGEVIECRDIIVSTLQKASIAVTVVADGREALAALDGERFDVVLIGLGFADTIETVRRIRGDARLRWLPLISFGAQDEEETKRSHAAGINEHLAAPVDGVALIGVLLRWLPEPTAGAGNDNPPSVVALPDGDGLQQLERLAALLDENEFVPSTTIDSLRTALPTAMESIAALKNALARFDYAEARQCLAHIKATYGNADQDCTT